jgi:hypothetical protein
MMDGYHHQPLVRECYSQIKLGVQGGIKFRNAPALHLRDTF